jgi:uncharacterized protein YdhG (YjbR/CyaY superfamily)
MAATTVDDYLAALPDDRRGPMETLRHAIRAGAPDAVETIAYNMPAFRTADGRFLVSYDAFKAHYSLFPSTAGMIAAFGSELAPYLAGKGTIRFPVSRPIPEDLVTRLVSVRVAELAGEVRLGDDRAPPRHGR